tara:strand:- start:2480 stop:3682 length:1203 start_codon:yes stop_codon:yes gene_type:complete
MNYSELSYSLTKQLEKDDKKQQGIYFTPQKTICHILDILSPHMSSIENILEPSCGSCEFINAIQRDYPNKKILGIEQNNDIYKSIKPYSNEQVTLLHGDFLKYTSNTEFDLIIGNPPYFVLGKQDVDEQYLSYFDGRPNIFILFIIHSLSFLKYNGILCFVLPKCFVNSFYYDKTRKYIAKYFQILNLIDCNDNYIETKQETVVLIVRKCPPEKISKYMFEIKNQTVFGTVINIEKFSQLLQNSTTLKELGFRVSIGNVVWNQVKSLLTDDETKTRLIYSSNIENKQFVSKKYANDAKKNFIDKPGVRGPMLVINRGYGTGTYNFEYCLLNPNFDYLIENHLMCIHYEKDHRPKELIELYQKIIRSFENPKTQDFVQHYFGNSAINSTELNTILPIYFDN